MSSKDWLDRLPPSDRDDWGVPCKYDIGKIRVSVITVFLLMKILLSKVVQHEKNGAFLRYSAGPFWDIYSLHWLL